MSIELGALIRYLLIDAELFTPEGDYMMHVVDIVGDNALDLCFNEGNEELRSISLASLCEPPVVIVPTDAAWANWRARGFKASLVPADA